MKMFVKKLRQQRHRVELIWNAPISYHNLISYARYSMASFLCAFEHCISQDLDDSSLRRQVVIDLRGKLYRKHRSSEVLTNENLQSFHDYPHIIPKLLGWLLDCTYLQEPFVKEVNDYSAFIVKNFEGTH